MKCEFCKVVKNPLCRSVGFYFASYIIVNFHWLQEKRLYAINHCKFVQFKLLIKLLSFPFDPIRLRCRLFWKFDHM